MWEGGAWGTSGCVKTLWVVLRRRPYALLGDMSDRCGGSIKKPTLVRPRQRLRPMVPGRPAQQHQRRHPHLSLAAQDRPTGEPAVKPTGQPESELRRRE